MCQQIRRTEKSPWAGSILSLKRMREFLRRKQMILALMNDKAYVPMKMKELAILLDIPKEQRRELKSVLDALLKEGQISLSAKGKLGRPETFALTGILPATSKGIWLCVGRGRERMSSFPVTGRAAPCMAIRCRLSSRRKITGNGRKDVLSVFWNMPMKNLVGIYEKSKGFGFVIPDNQKVSKDIFIPQGCDAGA